MIRNATRTSSSGSTLNEEPEKRPIDDDISAANKGGQSQGDFTLPLGGSETSLGEFPGRAVGTPIEPPSTLPEGSFLAFDPPRGRVKFTMQWMRL